MKIYSHEKNLKDVIKASLSSSVVVTFNNSDEKVDLFKKSVATLETEKEIKSNLNDIVDDPHPDLLYGSAILVSTNMNLNDDIFLPEEVWVARNTPINTPYNVEHESTDIIGHIIGSKTVDKEGNEISEIADNFDIEVAFVMYKFIYPELAENIISKAESGQQAVSMECILEDFDYGLLSDSGELKVISRNEDTSFLTKSLRIYGGTGTYNNMKLGRVLRSIRFVGMGSVNTPANPDSQYLNFVVPANNKFNVYKDLEELEKSISFIYKDERGTNMTIKTLEEAQEVIAGLETKVSEGETTLSELNQKIESLTSEKAELEASVAELAESLETEKGKLSLAEEKLSEANTKLKTKEDKLTETETLYQEASQKLAEIEKAKVLAERVAKLKSLDVPVTDEKKEKISAMTDDQFANTVEWLESLKPQASKETEEEDKVEDTESLANKALDEVEKDELDEKDEATASTKSEEEKEDDEVNSLTVAMASLSEFLTQKQKPSRGILNK